MTSILFGHFYFWNHTTSSMTSVASVFTLISYAASMLACAYILQVICEPSWHCRMMVLNFFTFTDPTFSPIISMAWMWVFIVLAFAMKTLDIDYFGTDYTECEQDIWANWEFVQHKSLPHSLCRMTLLLVRQLVSLVIVTIRDCFTLIEHETGKNCFASWMRHAQVAACASQHSVFLGVGAYIIGSSSRAWRSSARAGHRECGRRALSSHLSLMRCEATQYSGGHVHPKSE